MARLLLITTMLLIVYSTIISCYFNDESSDDIIDEPELYAEEEADKMETISSKTVVETFRLANIVDKVNSMKTTWKAGENFHPKTPISYLKTLAGTYDVSVKSSYRTLTGNCEDIAYLPKEFDARKKWDYCPSIKTIYDQGNCGSCWAVAPASAFSDRLCIRSKGNFTGKLSVQALLSCCYKCFDRNGCNGGWPESAWKFFLRHGLITGGTYASNEGCQPYLIKPCGHHVENSTLPLCKPPIEQAPRCKLSCYNSGYQNPWKKDLHKAKRLIHISPCQAMKEIYYHGPITARFVVHSDFYTYKSGVYQYVAGERVGGHAVRVIGWGEENGIEYWLVANSWNKSWGENGIFKMRRGTNEFGFEDSFIAGKAVI